MLDGPNVRGHEDHSSACQDYNALAYDADEYIGECICQPSENRPAPDTYELWWCNWCGEESCEASDPCQRCGEPVERRRYVAARVEA